MRPVETQNEEVTQIQPTKNRGGEWITFGTEAYRVPALSFLSIQELQGRVAAMAALGPNGQPTAEQMNTVIDVVHAAIKRNYPALTVQDVADMVDLQNYQVVLGAVLNIAGFKPAAEVATSGEAKASTGAESTLP